MPQIFPFASLWSSDLLPCRALFACVNHLRFQYTLSCCLTHPPSASGDQSECELLLLQELDCSDGWTMRSQDRSDLVTHIVQAMFGLNGIAQIRFVQLLAGFFYAIYLCVFGSVSISPLPPRRVKTPFHQKSL
jgi:hypothetical protein